MVKRLSYPGCATAAESSQGASGGGGSWPDQNLRHSVPRAPRIDERPDPSSTHPEMISPVSERSDAPASAPPAARHAMLPPDDPPPDGTATGAGAAPGSAGRGGGTGATHRELAIPLSEQQPESGRRSSRHSALFDDLGYHEEQEPTTETMRITDYGSMPAPSVHCDRPVLLRLDGPHAGEIAALGQSSFTVGRQRDNELYINDGGISRIHARIHRQEGLDYIEDLQSLNGTYVRGCRISRCALSDGDFIQLGPRVAFRYSMLDDRQEQLLRQLYESSTRDALTGAFNRQHFYDRLESELAYADRHAAELSLVIFDIDHFKAVNDTHGHPAGDAVLKQLSACVARQLRTEDVLARVGGEEFAVILRNTDLSGAARVAERLRATVSVFSAVADGKALPVTISAGCASLTCCSEHAADALILRADERLYAAKNAGRNRVVAIGP